MSKYQNLPELFFSKAKENLKNQHLLKINNNTNEIESWTWSNTYPKRGRELNEKHGNKCATQTGRVRSAQLAEGEPISEETIKRMYSYLSRAEEYYDPSDTSACGTISYLLWGGKAGLRWAKSKLTELELLWAVEVEMALEYLEERLSKEQGK